MRLLPLFVVLALAACTKKDDKKAEPGPPPSPPAAAVGADGIRHIAIDASDKGYNPDRIPGKAGEKLVLVFTRTYQADCISQLKTPDGKLVPLPLNKPVEVTVTVPQTGEVGFACGMDMFHGVVVAEK